MRKTVRVEQRDRRVRRTSVTLLLLASAGFLALALRASQHHVATIDVAATRAVQSIHLPLYGWVLTHVSDLVFYGLLSAVTYAAVGIPLVLCGRRLEAIVAVVSSGLASLVDDALKALIAEARPSAALVHVVGHRLGYGFPSGHVIHYTTLVGFAFYIVGGIWHRSPPRDLVLVLLALLVALVGPSRVYVGAHWPSDVLGTYLLAGVWLAGTIALYRTLGRHPGPARAGQIAAHVSFRHTRPPTSPVSCAISPSKCKDCSHIPPLSLVTTLEPLCQTE